jgi:hypothetical protein
MTQMRHQSWAGPGVTPKHALDFTPRAGLCVTTQYPTGNYVRYTLRVWGHTQTPTRMHREAVSGCDSSQRAIFELSRAEPCVNSAPLGGSTPQLNATSESDKYLDRCSKLCSDLRILARFGPKRASRAEFRVFEPERPWLSGVVRASKLAGSVRRARNLAITKKGVSKGCFKKR